LAGGEAQLIGSLAVENMPTPSRSVEAESALWISIAASHHDPAI
jgi:hypothetical protein